MRRIGFWFLVCAALLAAGVLLSSCGNNAPGSAAMQTDKEAAQVPASGSMQQPAQPQVPVAGGFAAPEMIRVPAGSFTMGSDEFPNARPVHAVSLSDDFFIGKYEITNRQYAAMLNYAWEKGYLDKAAFEPDSKKKEARGLTAVPQKYQDVLDEHSQIGFQDGVFAAHPGKEDFPVVEVTWYGAAFYCNMLSEKEGLTPLYDLDDWSCQVYGKEGYRLPTEAEWEYAARYDDGRSYPWGNAAASDAYANIQHTVKNPVDVDTSPVGRYSPRGDSKLGICDLSGNVAEWCNDWYNDRYSAQEAVVDPVGPGQVLFFNLPVFKQFRAARVMRGGSFLLDPDYRKGMGPPFVMDTVIHPQVYHNAFRSFDYLSRQVEGFRVARTVVGDKTRAAFSDPEK